MAGGYSSDAQKTADILDLTTQTIPWGGNLNKIPTQPYLAGPIRRSRYPIWPYGPIFVPYIYSTFEDVLYSFKFAKWWIRGYIFWFIPGSPWHHWCGQQGGDSQHHWFSGCIGARLVEIYIVISTIEYYLMTNAVVPSRLSSVQKRQSGMSRHKAAEIRFLNVLGSMLTALLPAEDVENDCDVMAGEINIYLRASVLS